MSADVEIRDLSGTTMTVSVRVTRELRVRLWIATRMIQLAAFVLRSEVDIDCKNEDEAS